MISIDVQTADFEVAAEYSELCRLAPRAGAVVFFVGLVRDFYSKDSADQISHIELTHYAGMTERLCEQICNEAQQRFAFDAARVVHRVGKLAAGEQIVLVAVAGGHRASAFDAAQFIMDYLKTRATLWKRETGSRGEHWVGMKQQDKSALSRWENV